MTDKACLPPEAALLFEEDARRRPSPEGARLVEIVRSGHGCARDTDWVAEEVPVALSYNGISHAVMMTTPRMLKEFAIGFSLAEGIVHSLDEIYDVEVLPACRDGFTVELSVSSEAFWKLKSRRRSMTGRTGCGLCGVESLEAARPEASPIGHAQRFSIEGLDDALEALVHAETLGRLTGATHAAVWIGPDGRALGGAEDVGRHVALDKLLGLRALSGWKEGALVVSSRASYEMVQKALRCGVEILFAVSAPTALAVDLAREAGMTLAAFCRRGRANIYSGGERITGLEALQAN